MAASASVLARSTWRARTRPGVLQHRLDDGQHVGGVVGVVPVEALDGVEHPGREGLVEAEVLLQVEVRPGSGGPGLVGLVEHLEDVLGRRASGTWRWPAARGGADVLAGFVGLAKQVPHGAAAVAGPVEQVQQQGVGDGEAGGRAARARTPPGDGRCPPTRARSRTRAACASPASSSSSGRWPRALGGPQVLDHVLGCLAPHPAPVVVALAPRPPGDLLELAHLQDPGWWRRRTCRAG